jgi:DNA topoisomerase-1
MGRYGPYVIIGTAEDEEKPKFYGLQPGQRLDSITLNQALELTKLPRELGESPDGTSISSNVGRFGPYVKYGAKFVSLKKEDDPYTITLDRALELVEEKKKIDAEREIKIFTEQDIKILNGRYGPYVTDGKKNARVPKDREPGTLTLEECVELLASAKVRPKRKRAAKKKKTDD